MQVAIRSAEQKLASIEFAENPEPRVPCVILLDTSSSMQTVLAELNTGWNLFLDSLHADDLARKRAEIAVVTFGGTVSTVQPFSTVDGIARRPFVASGDTPMCQALQEGHRLLAERKATLRANGISCYRPWIFLLTDGQPTDLHLWSRTVTDTVARQQQKQFVLFPIGVGESADFARLSQLVADMRTPLKLDGLDFTKFFLWLSTSLQLGSRSRVGSSVTLPDPTRGPLGWGVAAT